MQTHTIQSQLVKWLTWKRKNNFKNKKLCEIPELRENCKISGKKPKHLQNSKTNDLMKTDCKSNSTKFAPVTAKMSTIQFPFSIYL